jgi:hypothetical protein
MTRLIRLARECLFAAAALAAALAVWEWVLEIFHRQLHFLRGYDPIRLVELAALALLFVISLQLREKGHQKGTPNG